MKQNAFPQIKRNLIFFIRLKETFWLVQNECFPVCTSESKEKIIKYIISIFPSIKPKKVILFPQFCTQTQMEPEGETGAQHL